MATDKDFIIVTEAYSGLNIGDEELVCATLERAAAEYPGARAVLVARDPQSFEGRTSADEVRGRLFDRSEFAELSRIGRLIVLVRWSMFMVFESFATVSGAVKLRHIGCRFLRSAEREVYVYYMSALAQVPVGGGYLGDRYIKESLLTLWSWWWARRRGTPVKPMPMSVEADGWRMRVLLRIFRPSEIRARDESTVRVLRRAGIDCTWEPDLAFRNLREVADTPPWGPAVMVFPVGSDYFSPTEWMRVWGLVGEELSVSNHQLTGFSMHRTLPDGRAGYDREALEFLAERHDLSPLREGVDYYGDLCRRIELDARFVVTSRMHAAIASLCVGVPPVVLGYEEKHRSLMVSLGMGDVYLPFRDVDEASFRKLVQAALTYERRDVLARVHGYVGERG